MSDRITREEAAILAAKLFPNEKPEVIDVSLEPFSSEKLGYLGVHELLSIETHRRQVLTFFVKSIVPASDSFDRLIFREESKFFGEVVPRLFDDYKTEPWAAECYLVKEDLMVLEDLRSRGFKLVEDRLEEKELRAAVTSLARFHAASILLEDRLEEPLSEAFRGFFEEKVFVNDGGLSWKWLLCGVEVVEAIARNLDLDPKNVLAAYELTLEAVKPAAGRRNVLGHSDLWMKNMMFKKDDDGTCSCRLVDFQMVAYQSYAIDLVQLVYLNTDRSTRMKLEKQLIRLYCETLRDVLGSHGYDKLDDVNYEEVSKDFEEKRICGLVAAVQFFPLALLSQKLTKEYTEDSELAKIYMYTSRKEFVLKAMREDEVYRCRLEEAVSSLMKEMQNRS